MVVFDLYNEPFLSAQYGVMDPWACWRDGCTVASSMGISEPWQSAGMQTLLDAVRGTGAEQIVLLGGLQYAHDLSAWKGARPRDPLCNTAVSYHQYGEDCINEDCWNYRLGDILATLPFSDTQDFQDVSRGLVAPLDGPVTAADGTVVWDNSTYDFLTGEAPDSVNPSLWRQS